MHGSPKWKPPASGALGSPRLILLLIAAVAAIPRLLLGRSQFVEYDGYWHVFIAQQDNWNRFWADIHANAHPPLYFLLLKAILHFGHSLLAYRSISIVTGVASVYVVGAIARKVTGSDIRAYQSALAYGLALPAIIIACEVRSYMLSAFFVLLSFGCLLELEGEPRNEMGARAGFAIGAILACLSHYFAFFYAGAAILLLSVRLVWRSWKGEIANRRTGAAVEAATSLPVVATVLILYLLHAGQLAQIQGHLLPYYYDPAGKETMAAFLLRNWTNFLNLFSPFEITRSAVAVGILIAGVIGAVASASSSRRVRGGVRLRGASWTTLLTGLMLVMIAGCALAGKYPFGGDLRQQYLLFPFLVLDGAIFVEYAARELAGRAPILGRQLANGLAIVAIVGISAVRYQQFPKAGGKLLADRVAVFDRLEPAPQAVFLDQFNLITFFTFHDDWKWSFVKRDAPVQGIDIYRLRRGKEQILVFRDRADWNIEPGERDVYSRLAACLGMGSVTDLSVFAAQQTPPNPPLTAPQGVRQSIIELASESAVCTERLAVNQLGWYGTFRRSKCDVAAFPELHVTGALDDISEDIQYVGQWAHLPFPQASKGTLSFSKDAGAVARLSFEGTELTYVYTRAVNRGIAAVRLDGVSRGDIDLYSPGTAWQTKTTFGHLEPGKHTFELIVTGRKQAPATDSYVDLDGVVAR